LRATAAVGNGGSCVTLYATPEGWPGRWILEILASLERLAALGRVQSRLESGRRVYA